jgi:hypothetical protein
MFESFHADQDAPPEILWFERFWQVAIMVSAVIAIGMFDYTTSIVGAPAAISVNVVLFTIGIALMFLVGRRRSGLARWLTILLLLFLLAYDLSHLQEMIARGPLVIFALIRVPLMAVAISRLFTARARAWFAGRVWIDAE